MELSVIGRGIFEEEIVSGSRREERAVKALGDMFKEVADWVKTFYTPVVSWVEEECLIEANERVFKCSILPPGVDFEVEGRLVTNIRQALLVEEPVLLLGVRGWGLILNRVLQRVSDGRLKAVIIYDPLSDSYKREVVSGSSGLSLHTGSPFPIPVVSARKSDVRELLQTASDCRIRIYGRARLVRDAIGRTLVAGVNGRGELEVHASAHHDHWFNGVYDDLIGLEALLGLARRLRGAGNTANVTIISFTAREFGSPILPSWYWSWGSRFFTETLESKGHIDKVVANITIDNLTGSTLRASYHPFLFKCVKEVKGAGVVDEGLRFLPYLDSYSYLHRGVPSVALHNQPEHLMRGHLDHQEGSHFENTVVNLVDVSMRLVSCLSKLEDYDLEPVSNMLTSYAESEARYLAGKIMLMLNSVKGFRRRASVLQEFSPTIISYKPKLEINYGLLEDLNTILKAIEAIERNNYGGFLVEDLDDGPLIDVYVDEYTRDTVARILREVFKHRVRLHLSKSNKVVARILGVEV